MLTDKKIRLQSSFLRNERSDLDKSHHLYDDDYVPNCSHRINRERRGIMRDTVDNGSVGGIDLGSRRRHFESRSALGCQEAFNENIADAQTRLRNVNSHAQHCGSNASLSPRGDLFGHCIQQQQQQQHPNNVHRSSSLLEQNPSHTTTNEMSQFVQSSANGCLEASCERRRDGLRCLIGEQNMALERQSRKLGQLHCQVESYEAATHSRRISEDGPDYIYLAYLGDATEEAKEREKENGCSKRSEEMKASELLPVTQEAEHAERAKDDDRTSATVGTQITRISKPVRELHELDELMREFDILVAIGDSQKRQLLEISDEIEKQDAVILEKRFLCESLEEELQINGCYEEIYEQDYSLDQYPDFADSTDGQIESDFEFEVPQSKRRADRNVPLKPFFALETFPDSDTGLSSLGSESPAQLSPI